MDDELMVANLSNGYRKMDEEITSVKLQMDKARRRGHWQAYNDLKKHYDKLVAERNRRAIDKAIGGNENVRKGK